MTHVMDSLGSLTLSVLVASIKLALCAAETLETKVDRLSERLTLLDSKVSLDIISMRQDLGEVRKLVTDTSKTTAGGTDVSVKDENKQYDAKIELLQKEMNLCYSKERTLLRAFKEEKGSRKIVDEKLDTFKSEILEDIKGQLNELLENTQHETVSFSARALKMENIKPWETIVFPDVANNRGGAYNSSTGTFVAPLAGTYVFYCNILSKSQSYIEVGVQVNGDTKLLIYSSGDASFGSGSNLLVTNLKVGDKIRVVKYGPWGSHPFYIHNTWSTFSGFLLFKR